MPKKTDPQLNERAVRLVLKHRGKYSSTTAAAAAVARQLGVGTESVRRWVVQAEVDGGSRPGTTSEESAKIKKLKAENRRLREDSEATTPAKRSCQHVTQRRIVFHNKHPERHASPVALHH